MCVVKILVSLYRNQTEVGQVKWTLVFQTPNCNQQGKAKGVLCPYIFTVFPMMNYLFSWAERRCTVANEVLNDQLFLITCMFGLSINCLQCLLNIYCGCTAKHENILKCNKTASVCQVFNEKKFK